MDVPIWLVAVFVAYALPLLFIFVYSLTQLNLVYLCMKFRKKVRSLACEDLPGDAWYHLYVPRVTVQLPIFNEMYVVERLIDSVSRFDYPKDKFEIQVLDDSTDETCTLIEKKVENLKAMGLDISHIKRVNRTGYKAGALANGLALAKGELIAIFDADFLPSADFLLRTVPYFKDCRLGVVQTKWDHINEHYSLLTRLQAFGLDAHFNVEQRGRNAAGYFINFNGTAGVWRKTCIIEAGNWQSDTLTEDLDLSYRAQLKGWKFKYLGAENTPAELPVTMAALRTQQFRWTKGAVECARKNLPAVIASRTLPAAVKIHAFFHLTSNMVFPCILISSVLSIPFLLLKSNYPGNEGIYLYASFSLASLLALGAYYWTSVSATRSVSLPSFVARFIMFLSFSMGFSVHNTIAVIEGWARKRIPFVRTPKYNINDQRDTWQGKKYGAHGMDALTVIEGLMALYFVAGAFVGLYLREYALLPFHVMLALGFGATAGYTFWQSNTAQKTGE
jgi:cellulose synthase/poly-beta-1,6-N-acetylglucosamine synthase-like glycosyltransferase